MDQTTQYELTHPQQRIWYTEKLHPGTGMWNNAGTLKIKGRIDFVLLERALNIFLQENDSIRLRIGTHKGVPYQYVSPYEPCRAEVIDFSEFGLDKFYQWDRQQTMAPMPLIDSRLYYFALLSVGPSECWLYAKFHHIISDANSIVEFSNQVMETYRTLLEGVEPEVTIRPSYLDYLAAEQQYLHSKRYVYDREYWAKRFERLSEPTILKPKKSNDMCVDAQRKVFVMSESFAGKIHEYCRVAGISVFAMFLSALAIYINRVTGKNDIIIGAPVANRTTLNEKAMFGMFVSMVPVRISISDELSFTEFSQIVSNEWFSALKHQKYPFDVLMHELHQTYKNLDELYDVTLSYQYGKFHKNSGQFTYEGRWHFSGSQASALSIHVNDREDEGRFILDYDHHTPLFNDKEVEYFHIHLANIIRDMIHHPDKPLYMLDLLGEEERKRILYRFNNTARSYPQGETLTELLQRGFDKNPDAPAVICAGETITYRQLDERSDALAAHLVGLGVGADSIVGLLVSRSMDYCIWVAAILKSGGAFAPIAPDIPAERIAYMLADSGAKIVVASPEHAYKCPKEKGLHVLKSDMVCAPAGKLQPVCRPDSLAYVIYTSGSTGQPKGVQIEHRSIVHFVYSMRELWDLSPGGRVLGASSISFDVSVMEYAVTLTSGLTFVFAQEHEVTVPRNMVQLIQSAQVNMMVVTPGRMELLLSDKQGSECIANFREIGMAGDVVTEKLLSRVQQATRARIMNQYGPTEITILATTADITHAKIPSIGHPMPDVKAYILDVHQNLVPIGVPGELYIGGPGVARGYLNKPELNNERFIDNPFEPGTKLYRTGDLTRWYPLGEIEFLGRIDKQVKIRGFRIELGEIESRLLGVPGVTSCAVTAYTNDASGSRFLCAYLCGNLPKSVDIKAQLSRDLPAYMIPSMFIPMESLPFTNSGKVDRNKLPDPMAYLETQESDYQPPETATERMLAEIWSTELGLARIGRNDSFFDLGGDSLSILQVMTQIEQQFHVAFPHEEVYRSPMLKDMAAIIDAAEQSSYRPVVPAALQRDYPVSSAQQRMWVVAQSKDSIAYNIPLAFEIAGEVDLKRLQSAFQQLVNHHEALRTSFVLRGTKLRQRIHKNVRFHIETMQCEKRGLKRVLKGLIRPFDLGTAPLMRAVLIETAPQRHVLFIDVHHIISDQHSQMMMLRNLSALYRGEKLAHGALSYKDYAVWHQDFMKSENMNMQREYWKSLLAGELPLLNLHTDRPRPAQQRFDGARYAFRIDKKAEEALRGFANQHGGTLFMAALAVYNVLLMKYTGQEDIIIGTPTSGRTRDELRDITGVFINTLPMRCFPRGDQSFADFFGSVAKSCAAAFSNEDCPLERMIADIGLSRDASRNPLFDTMLVVAKKNMLLSLEDTRTSLYPFDPGFAKLDITLELYEDGDGLQCYFEYNKRLFKRSTIQRMASHFCRLFSILPESPEGYLSDAEMMSQQEIWQVTQGFNQTDVPLDPEQSVQSIFENQAKYRANKIALIVNGESVTFAQLNIRANSIAHLLREKGVGRNSIVALGLKRSVDLIAAMLGVLKAGGGYLPLDISYPSDRVSYMLSNCGTRIMLSDGSSDIPFDGENIYVGEIQNDYTLQNPERVDRMDDIAYVMYTSGSTGLPKGTVLPRRGLLNLYEGVKIPINYDPAQTSISITTVSFDIFICDAILPLFYGSTVVLCTEDELRQPNLIAGLIEKYDVKFIEATPTRMSLMLEEPAFRKAMIHHIEKIMVGGEMVPISLVRMLRKNSSARIINAYGPTETTVWSSFRELTKASRVTIGNPIANTRFYILDRNRRPVPVGVLGELYISGFGVGKGYIKRDDLNRTVFLPDPFWPGQMMYKTGDVCAFLNDGDMEIFGRVDHQVKIRGLRIELGEIESAIRSLKGVEDAVVKDWGEGAEKYLCAYFVTAEELGSEAIRNYLTNKLPQYMVPSFFICMDELPTTLNGKVNRKALTEPKREAINVSTAKRKKEMTDIEKKMARIWSKVLKVEGIGPESNYLALGGDSLGIIKIQAAVLQYDWKLNTKDFYECKTLRELCKRINASVSNAVQQKQEKWDRHIPALEQRKPVLLKNVLLTGATGYFGAYLLAELIKMPNTNVYCLVRGQSDKYAKARLYDALHFYFGKDFCMQNLSRITVLKGDITKDHFGLNDLDYHVLMEKVDTVIHSAANTDHIGRQEVFEEINVQGTRRAVSFAKEANAAFIHVSTESVSGISYNDKTKKKGIFTEGDFYIGQNLDDNVYVRSKFLSEAAVLKEVKDGLNARIFRIGLLTAAMDGKFQLEPDKNAFAKWLKSVRELGCVPMGSLDKKIEMTPVDVCAQMLLQICQSSSEYVAYHLYNTNYITMAGLVNMLEENGCSIQVVSDKEFFALIKKLSRSGKYTELSGLILEMSSIFVEPAIRIVADITGKILKSLSLEWPIIDSAYLGRFMESAGCLNSGEGEQWI